MDIETLIPLLILYAVVLVPLALFIRGASRSVYLTDEEIEAELKVYNEQIKQKK
jgi:hypothetical protein